MTIKPAVVFILADAQVHVSEGICGGGEVATISLARAFSKLGYRTLVFGNIPAGDVNVSGVEFINYGADYNMQLVMEKLRDVGPYYAFGATFIHPFLLLKNDTNCLSKIVINHSPNVNPGGLEASTVLNIVDYQVSVSDAQRRLMLARGDVPIEKLPVVKNGFDPELFKYSGPENRDFNRLVFTGRLEFAKGIEIVITAYQEIKQKFPEIKLDIYGSGSSWPQATNVIKKMCALDPNIRYHGTVPQTEIAEALATCGLLLFPSVTFESAGLAVVDAQASGCPVLANAVGGVSEYVFDNECGVLVRSQTSRLFVNELIYLLQNKHILREMSINCKTKARNHTWEVTARKLLGLIEKKDSIQGNISRNPLNIIYKNKILFRGWNNPGVGSQQLLDDHEDIMKGSVVREDFLDKLIVADPSIYICFFWRGLLYERQGDKVKAIACYKKSAEMSNNMDWQPLYRLASLLAEMGRVSEAGVYALHVISVNDKFPLRDDLEKIVEASGVLQKYLN